MSETDKKNTRGWLKILAIFLAGFIFGLVFPGTAPEQTATQEVKKQPQIWTCSMHPEIKQPKQGKCPKCFMDLIPLSEDSFSASPGELKLSDAAARLAQVQTSQVSSGPATRTLRLPGTIQLDETRVKHVTAWVGGRIEKLHVNYTGIPVQINDHMAEFYSPDLLAAREELRRTIGNESLHRAVTERLLRWGISPEQVEQFKLAEQNEELVTINSPAAGIVIEKSVKEGMYVNQGTRLFSIADMKRLWLVAAVYERDIQWLRYGQKVECEFEAYPGRIFPGVISFISPVLSTSSRTVDARINIDNEEGQLKPGMFGRVTVKVAIGRKGEVLNPALAGKWISPMHPEVIKDGPGSCDVCGMALVPVESVGISTQPGGKPPLLVPETAVLWSGTRSLVFRKSSKKENTYEASEIILGPKVDSGYLVFSGLEAGDEIVSESAFKLDAEQQIRAGLSMMSPDRVLSEPQQMQKLSEDEKKALEGFLSSCLEISRRLAADELPNDAASQAHKKLSPLMHSGNKKIQAVAEKLMPPLMNMAGEKEIKVAREHLLPLTSAIKELLLLSGGQLELQIHEDYCPMAFDNKGASWFQAPEELANPYFGAMMLRCGETRKVWNKDSN